MFSEKSFKNVCEIGLIVEKPKENDCQKIEKNNMFVDNPGFRLMQKMGYITGAGLGKKEQGIKEPIITNTNLGTRGFGLNLQNLQLSNEDWDFSREEIHIEQKVTWLENKTNRNFTAKKMRRWIVEGSPKSVINDCYFCNKHLLQQVKKGKEIFDALDSKELGLARTRSNPFEKVRSVFFMNRAALKMANIDAATDFMFTDIENNIHHSNHGAPYYFADVCAGPGGFTEYVLWRKDWLYKGFGLTLKDENDFKLNESTCANPATFQPLYGSKGDGNVCCPQNIKDFKQKVLWETDNLGVHFMMSDGGFCVDGKENFQEVLSKNIYICQCLVALEILRNHGHFVTKLFDVFTPFSVGLLYLMYNCFEKVAIFKPNASRPANSERYFVCCNLQTEKPQVEIIKTHLWNIVNKLWQQNDSGSGGGNPETDILSIVPVEVITNDDAFYKYITESNNKFAERQIIGLEKLATFCRNPQLIDVRQDELREKCLDYWHIPDKVKILKTYAYNEDHLPVLGTELLSQAREMSNLNALEMTVVDLEDWHYCPMYCPRKTNNCYFYAGVGYTKVCRYQRDKWVRVKNMQLSKGTLLYGEFVREKVVSKEEPNSELYKYSLHVIDALQLGEKKLLNVKYTERWKMIKQYCKAVNKEYQENTIRLRPKIVKPLYTFVTERIIKSNKQTNGLFCDLPVLGYNVISETIDVNSLLLLKTNENQSFNSTYLLQIQVFLRTQENRDDDLPIESLLTFIKEQL